MKAYSVQDDEGGIVVFANSNAAARREGGLELGGDWSTVDTCRRAPEFDQYAPGPVPAQALLDAGWWLECHGCSERIQEEWNEEGQDDEGFFFEKQPVCVGTRAWCCARCQAIDFAAEREREAGKVAVVEMVLAKYPETISVIHAYAGPCIGAHWNSDEWEAAFTLPGLQHSVSWRGKDRAHVRVAQVDVEAFTALYGPKS